YIRSIQVAGPNATDFEIKSGGLNNSLLKPNSSHEITVEYVGTDVESSAVLRIEYGNSSIKEIQLVGDGIYEQVSLFLNSGSSVDEEFEGETFAGDRNFPEFFNTSNVYTNSQASSLPLFNSERSGTVINYSIPLPNGIYTVKTFHNE